MPSYNGGDSWGNLLTAVYGTTSNAYGVNRIRRWPLNYMSTGLYASGSSSGYIYERITSGSWWMMAGYNAKISNSLLIGSTNVHPSGGSNTRGSGTAIRCVVRS